MKGFRFDAYEDKPSKTPFEKLLDIFMELLTHTSGDVDEAEDWLRELDKEYNLTDESFTIDDFMEELKRKGFVEEKKGGAGGLGMTSKAEQVIRKRSLDQVFGKMKKSKTGGHKTNKMGSGDEITPETRPFQFGDDFDRVALTESLRNAQIRGGVEDFNLREDDLVMHETEHKALTSTVLMIDLSHSMILYGEDRITPAKKVAMALAELITTRYPKDTLDIIAFGNDAWRVRIKDLPFLKVGPFHTNTVAGLELALDILKKKKNPNRQIFMITDGKPSCLKNRDGSYYKNSFGLDPKIVNKTLNLAASSRKSGIPITTFMIARDPYLQEFVQQFTEANKGKAFYTSLQGLGDFVFEDYEKNRRKNVR
ncbi:MAG: VWA domain-containing protein [Salibacteraceae bacterium]